MTGKGVVVYTAVQSSVDECVVTAVELSKRAVGGIHVTLLRTDRPSVGMHEQARSSQEFNPNI